MWRCCSNFHTWLIHVCCHIDHDRPEECVCGGVTLLQDQGHDSPQCAYLVLQFRRLETYWFTYSLAGSEPWYESSMGQCVRQGRGSYWGSHAGSHLGVSVEEDGVRQLGKGFNRSPVTAPEVGGEVTASNTMYYICSHPGQDDRTRTR